MSMIQIQVDQFSFHGSDASGVLPMRFCRLSASFRPKTELNLNNTRYFNIFWNMERKVNIPSACGALEGLRYSAGTDKAVVITHPHPQYGGDMYSPVVEAIASAYRQKGYSTLRFNFRGTGNSAGSYDDGVGERQDVIAAVTFLHEEGAQSIHLSGYSFGAWVNAMALQERIVVDGVTLVAPPVAFIDFADGIRLPGLKAVLAGSRDEFGPPSLVRPLLDRWNPLARLEIIDGADHFFFGYLDELTRMLIQVLKAVD
jgi:hypothetical protein